MKTTGTVKLVIGISLLSGTALYAAPKGQPFMELSAQIAENRSLIEANQDSINSLESDLSSLQVKVSDIETDLNILSETVTVNVQAIASAALRIQQAEENINIQATEIESIKSDITAIVLQHNLDYKQLTLQIAQLRADLGLVAEASSLQAEQLNSQLAQIRAAVDSNSGDISTLMLEIINLNGQLTTVNSDYISLTEQLNSVEVTLTSYATDIQELNDALARLEAQIDELEGRISGLEVSPTSCENNTKWQPVDCQTSNWVWSSNRESARNVTEADAQHVLWASDSRHTLDRNTCSLTGTGWVSTQEVTMSGCNSTWYHLGGRYTGNCGGHDGDIVRRLTMDPNGCYDY